MRRVMLLMGMSLDGYAASGWLPPARTKRYGDEQSRDVWKALASVDAFIMGRVTYDIWRRFWPTAASSRSELDARFSRLVEQAEKIVFSKTLESVDWNNARLGDRNLADEIASMRRTRGKNIAIVGGGKIARAFGDLGLIDDYYVWVHPLIQGSGTMLLGAATSPQKMRLIEAKAFKSGVTRLHFRFR